MLSIKEIHKIGEKTYPTTMSAEGYFLDSQPVFDQAKAYVSLVEKIKAEDEEAFTIQPAIHLKRFNHDALIAGWDECIKELKSFIDES